MKPTDLPMLTAARLHLASKHSLRLNQRAMRAYLETGSAERFLTDLLFIELQRNGYNVTREYGLGKRFAADLVVHTPNPLIIEAKQNHLKDGARLAFRNLKKDLKRHLKEKSFGIIYVVDETRSHTIYHVRPFGNQNRNTPHRIRIVLNALKDNFSFIYPRQARRAVLRVFKGHGGVTLYAFIVRL
jgi:hypothetical protein